MVAHNIKLKSGCWSPRVLAQSLYHRVPLASVCADGFQAGEVPSTSKATWEAEFQLLSPTNRPWLEEKHGVLDLCTAGVISSINDK